MSEGEPFEGAATDELELPVVMDIQAAGPLYGSLRGLRGRSVVLDASNVQRVGGQCLQVLLAAAAAWRLDGRELTLGSASPGFADGLSLLGFSSTSLFGKDATL